MRKFLYIFTFTFSVLYAGTVIGQSNDANKTVFVEAIELIEENTTLSTQVKKKFISRLEFIAKSKVEIQEKEYNRIASNYQKTTGIDLPKFAPLKK